MPIHEGYEALLDSHMPVLADEAHALVALAFPKALPQQQQQQQGTAAAGAAVAGGGAAGRPAQAWGSAEAAPHVQADAGSAEVQGALAALLAGIDGELLGLIDSVRPQRLLLCLPMLAVTLGWKQRLAARGAEARPLVALLAQCEQRLTAVLAGHFSERAGAIQRCARNTGGQLSVQSGWSAVSCTQHRRMLRAPPLPASARSLCMPPPSCLSCPLRLPRVSRTAGLMVAPPCHQWAAPM